MGGEGAGFQPKRMGLYSQAGDGDGRSSGYFSPFIVFPAATWWTDMLCSQPEGSEKPGLEYWKWRTQKSSNPSETERLKKIHRHR